LPASQPTSSGALPRPWPNRCAFSVTKSEGAGESHFNPCALAHVRSEARSGHGNRGGDVAADARDGAIETSTSEEIDATKVSVPKHFGHSKVRESKPGLSGSMIRNDIVSPHFGHRGLLILSTNIAHPPLLGLARHFVACRGMRTIRRALRKTHVRKVTD
jgi:hypothetical protein